ncbi:S41 family peptidase [Acetonema longum]|uniref:Carboxyl-terminal protease n=1 Tax=Acetonema longum DSM 6540 TaxID=1009370 RepID=F7NNZ1_9FIRM|nr:S41 family peptidase [Acetonema longum]EGO62325.1 carboxyl-terminal protease [Acetonema longum DSM 6540]
MSNRRKLFLGAVALVLITFLLTSGAFLFLFQSGSLDAANMLRLIRAVNVIQARYIEEVPVEKLVSGAIKGMVQSLEDPHSIYLDAKMFKEFMVETEGSFGGVGIVVGVKDKILTVVSPIEGTPGDKAGIKSGDQIIQIDGKDTKDLQLDEAVSKIRGPEGTNVVLSIRRLPAQEVKDYVLTRSNIQIKTVASKMLPDDIGYIRISMFNENTSPDFISQYRDLEKKGMKAMILDLRDNPGGLLDQSVKVSGLIVPKGPVVSVITRDGQKETHSSDLETVKYPLAVLVNGGSASASEIVAGAVQDTGAGTLIGTKTYGKGSVQTIMRLDSSTAVKLTIAKYYTPNGRSIHGTGIEPDIALEWQEPAPDVKDPQMEKAVEVLKSKLSGK